jgi:thymidylate synthase
MNNLDKQYSDLLQDILDNGHQKGDRTGTGTISVFGRQIRHNMKDGFPLITTKKMYTKGIITELIWFLRGETNIKSLVENDCHIWNGDAYKKYCNDKDTVGPLTMAQFIEEIKTNEAFAKKWGDLGPVYGKQWRNWSGIDRDAFLNTDNIKDPLLGGRGLFFKEYEIDQLANAIEDLKTNPDSRRIIVSAWNVGEMGQMTLPPCHNFFQFYTRELSLKERAEAYNNMLEKQNYNPKWQSKIEDIDKLSEYELMSILQSLPGPTRAISLMWNQRSVDVPLGLPFNIASYGLLLEIVAKMVNMIPEELIGNLGDTHIYSNQVDGCLEQIGRSYTHEERTEMLKEAMGDKVYNEVISELMPFGGGMSEYYESYNIPRRSREPYKLPKLGFNKSSGFFKELGDDLTLLSHLDSSDFMIENYISHPAIKMPLSN